MKLRKNQMISPKYFRFPRWKIRNFLGRKPESYRRLVLARLVSLVALVFLVALVPLEKVLISNL